MTEGCARMAEREDARTDDVRPLMFYLVFGGFLVNVGILAAIASSGVIPHSAAPSRDLEQILGASGLVFGCMALAVRRLLVTEERLTPILNAAETRASCDSAIYKALFVPFLVSWVLAESVAIFGFVLAAIGAPSAAYPLFGFSLVALFANFPRLTELREKYRPLCRCFGVG